MPRKITAVQAVYISRVQTTAGGMNIVISRLISALPTFPTTRFSTYSSTSVPHTSAIRSRMNSATRRLLQFGWPVSVFGQERPPPSRMEPLCPRTNSDFVTLRKFVAEIPRRVMPECCV